MAGAPPRRPPVSQVSKSPARPRTTRLGPRQVRQAPTATRGAPWTHDRPCHSLMQKRGHGLLSAPGTPVARGVLACGAESSEVAEVEPLDDVEQDRLLDVGSGRAERFGLKLDRLQTAASRGRPDATRLRAGKSHAWLVKAEDTRFSRESRRGSEPGAKMDKSVTPGPEPWTVRARTAASSKPSGEG